MTGEIFVLLSQMLWALVLIIQKKLNMDALILTLALNAIGTLVMLPVVLRGMGGVKENLGLIAVAAILQTAGLFFYLGGLRSVSANTASLMFMTFPLFTSFFAMVFLGEQLTFKVMIAFGLMAAGLIVLVI